MIEIILYMINYFSKSTGGGRGGKGPQDEGSMLIFLYSMRIEACESF